MIIYVFFTFKPLKCFRVAFSLRSLRVCVFAAEKKQEVCFFVCQRRRFMCDSIYFLCFQAPEVFSCGFLLLVCWCSTLTCGPVVRVGPTLIICGQGLAPTLTCGAGLGFNPNVRIEVGVNPNPNLWAVVSLLVNLNPGWGPG